MIKRAIELLRVSTAEQAAEDKASLPAQRAINKRTALAYGLTIVRSIEMADVSGAAVLMAPEVKELLTLMLDPEIHGIVAREFSRLMRPENFTDYALLQAFADSNTVLYLPEGPIDFASKTGRLLGTIRAAIAGMERTEILERVWGAKEEKRKNGGFAQSRICLPVGVDYSGGWSYTAEAERVRESFRLLLSGNTSYADIGRRVGIPAFNLRNIFRNPIYTGWRVIDKRRDPSPGGKYATKDGRQGDRRKIKRLPEDVIRVKVIDEPLISEADFAKAQRIMDRKKEDFWRMNSGPHRFTYNGFLTCTCQKRIYTKSRRDDYYLCSGRCGVHYMRRDRLETQLDVLFTRRLTSSAFLRRAVLAPLKKKTQPAVNVARLRGQIDSLTAKRQRVLDGYFEGVIAGGERDVRLAEIDRDRKLFDELLSREQPKTAVTLEILADAFAPFVEFDDLNRDDKRTLLNTLTPSIVVSEYEIQGMFIGLDVNRTTMSSHGADRIWLPIAA